MAIVALSLARSAMVEVQLAQRGIIDQRILNAMSHVPRHLFVPASLADIAYSDRPLPIGFDQTISQPFIVAMMGQVAAISPDDRLLEVGTGCGYSAAVYSRLAERVDTVESIIELSRFAEERLQRLGYHNIACHSGDGSLGLPLHSPYDVIIVTAAAPTVPEALKRQLKLRGRLIIPVSDGPDRQILTRITRYVSGFVEEKLCDVAFVPLIGVEGYASRPQHP